MTISKKAATEKAIEALILSVKDKPLKGHGGTGGQNCFHGTVSRSGSVKENIHACHSGVAYYQNPFVFYNRYCIREHQMSWTIHRAYFDWITGKDSPWNEFQARCRSHTPESLDKEDDSEAAMNWVFENGWVWSDLSHPVNLQHSFLTAARMSPEWPMLISTWHRWVEALGFEYRALAFVFLTLFSELSGNKQWMISHSNKYDWPLDTGTCDVDYVKNFCHGTPVGPWQPSFSETSRYTPVNAIWGNSGVDADNKPLSKIPYETYPMYLFRVYSRTHGCSEKDAMEFWSKNSYSIVLPTFDFSKKWFVSETELLDIIRLEHRKIYGEA